MVTPYQVSNESSPVIRARQPAMPIFFHIHIKMDDLSAYMFNNKRPWHYFSTKTVPNSTLESITRSMMPQKVCI
jgi:hypothetical protein